MRRLALIALLCLTACSDPQDTAQLDAEDTDVQQPDPDTPDTAGPDIGDPDVPQPDAAPDTGEPTQTLRGDLGGEVQDFGTAFYGLTDPALLATETWGIHLEAHIQGLDACPQQDSPSPDATLILIGLTATDADPSEVAIEMPAGATLIDFKGEILNGEVLTRATAVSMEVLEAEVCTACVGQPAPSHPDGVVLLQLEATFPEGTIAGQLRARPCDSMDELAP
jgi:hypothetical protein